MTTYYIDKDGNYFECMPPFGESMTEEEAQKIAEDTRKSNEFWHGNEESS